MAQQGWSGTGSHPTMRKDLFPRPLRRIEPVRPTRVELGGVLGGSGVAHEPSQIEKVLLSRRAVLQIGLRPLGGELGWVHGCSASHRIGQRLGTWGPVAPFWGLGARGSTAGRGVERRTRDETSG